MCLAVPGKLVAMKSENEAEGVGGLGTVDFQGSRIEVSLAFTPEARVGDWLLVHAGFALQVLDEEAARETWQYLEEAGLAAAELAEVKGETGST
jgi:hydrogenase expression/formation protein HypC